MTKLPTTEKPSIKDSIVSGLLLGIKSFDRAVTTQWRLLLISVPVITTVTMSLGYLTAPEPCRQSSYCVELHIVQSTRPLFNWIQELNDLPDEGKLPVLIAIACVLLYAFAVFVYASQDLVSPPLNLYLKSLELTPKKGLRIMSKPHNPCSASPLPWCNPQDQEAMTRAILQNTSTQFQFRTDDPADDSDERAEDQTPEGFR